MKKCVLLALCFFLFSGCSENSKEIETALELRSKLLQAQSCYFEAEITADYGDKLHIFTMDCIADANGDVTFSIIKPDSISGIRGTVSGEGGKLLFDETALHFPLLAEEQLTPVSAPWILIRTLRSGYMTSACTEDGKIRLSIADSYEEDPLCLDIWLDTDHLPERADILFDGRRILSVNVRKFSIL